MNTRYYCAICNTKPDQISHHKSHLQTQKHRDNRDSYSKELNYFSIYKLVHPKNWLEHDEIKEIIRSEYGKELTPENLHTILIEKLNVIDKYCKFEANKVFCKTINGKPTNVFVEPIVIYKKELELDNCSNKTPFLEWCIERVLKSKETIKDIKIMQVDTRDIRRAENIQRMHLARCVSTNYELLRNIRMNKMDIECLKDVWSFRKNLQYVEQPEYLNDIIVKYACVLFNAFGIMSLDRLIQEDSVEEYVYFHKEVEIETIVTMLNVEGYEKKSKISKKVWVKTKMIYEDAEEFNYVEDEVIRQKFRDYLIHFFTKRKEAFLEVINAEYKMHQGIPNTRDEDYQIIDNWKNKRYKFKANVKANFPEVEKDTEIVSTLLLDSDIFRNVMKLCEFFFEHKQEIIDQYFCISCEFEEEEETNLAF